MKAALIVLLAVWLVAVAAVAAAYMRGKLGSRSKRDGEHPPPIGLRSRGLGHGPYRARKQTRDD